MRRAQSGAGLSDELAYLEFLFQQHAFVDGISLEGMRERWNTFERKLPAFEDISEEQRAWVEQSIEDIAKRSAASISRNLQSIE